MDESRREEFKSYIKERVEKLDDARNFMLQGMELAAKYVADERANAIGEFGHHISM